MTKAERVLILFSMLVGGFAGVGFGMLFDHLTGGMR